MTEPSSRQPPFARIEFDGKVAARLPPMLARDVEQAMADLAEATHFHPAGLNGSSHVHVSVQNGRLVFDIRDGEERPLRLVGIALSPFRRLIKDYMMLVESHAMAVEEGREQRLEAIDMGRRGLHNEGAQQIMERLQGKIAVDLETARRLFTLLCVLQQR